MTVIAVRPDRHRDAVTVLCDAFEDYPVMRYVLGSAAGYPHRLRALIGFFVKARAYREEPVLGAIDARGRLAAVALVTLPGERAAPEALSILREAVWNELGKSERARYDAFGAATQPFGMAQPHHHLNMIGVVRSHAGQGFGRRLLEAVHRLSQADPASVGVTLTTESPNNVPLYTHVGYRLLGQARVAPGLETWAFFRPRGPTS
jgi:GNAT superfamily N-acetyltransferase